MTTVYLLEEKVDSSPWYRRSIHASLDGAKNIMTGWVVSHDDILIAHKFHPYVTQSFRIIPVRVQP